jgi:peptidyl-prolyl cis-trans isomerase A (cyclophilin A)
MRQTSWRRLTVGLFLLGGWLFRGDSLWANSIVQIDTSLGNIVLRLNDDAAPATVANFLNYVTDGDYAGTLIHRSVPGFVIQGGGFATSGLPIATDPPVVNEFSLPNVQGTIAMAKLGGDPDSATSQWFISLNDNRENLDNQNGGFTVFGHVLEGMDVVNQIAALQTFPFNSPFGEIPLRNYTTSDFNSGTAPGSNNLVVVNQAQVVGMWDGPEWHNDALAQDTTNDGNIIPQDLLALVDRRFRDGFSTLSGPLVGPYFVDVNANGLFDVDDIDRVLSVINSQSSIGSGNLAGGGLLSSLESSTLFTVVPEPASGTLALLFAVAFFRVCRRLRTR